MNQKVIILILAILLGTVFFLYRIKNTQKAIVLNKEQVTLSDNTTYLFVGDGCTHCENVEKFIGDNEVGGKITLEILEVFKEVGNQKYYLEALNKCNAPDKKNISVPVLYHNGECINGDVDIINKLKELTS